MLKKDVGQAKKRVKAVVAGAKAGAKEGMSMYKKGVSMSEKGVKDADTEDMPIVDREKRCYGQRRYVYVQQSSW